MCYYVGLMLTFCKGKSRNMAIKILNSMDSCGFDFSILWCLGGFSLFMYMGIKIDINLMFMFMIVCLVSIVCSVVVVAYVAFFSVSATFVSVSDFFCLNLFVDVFVVNDLNVVFMSMFDIIVFFVVMFCVMLILFVSVFSVGFMTS